jgi:hypothetical protein
MLPCGLTLNTFEIFFTKNVFTLFLDTIHAMNHINYPGTRMLLTSGGLVA